jgi:hypothetical protein
VRDDSFLLLFNAHYEDVDVPPARAPLRTRWELELRTGRSTATGSCPARDGRRRVALARRAARVP